jgi:hypothetical protein
MSEAKPFTGIAADAAGGSTFQDDEFSLVVRITVYTDIDETLTATERLTEERG